MRRLPLFIGLWIYATIGGIAYAAPAAQSVDSLFFAGVQAYRQGRYQESLTMLQSLDKVIPNHSRSTASLLMQAKAQYRLQNYRAALEAFRFLINRFPTSTYVDDAMYGCAEALYSLQFFHESVKQFLDLIEFGGDPRLLRKAAKLSIDLMEYRMDGTGLRRLLSEVQQEKSKAAVTIRLAQREIDKEHFQSAKTILSDFIGKYDQSPYVPQMNQLLSRVERAGEGVIKIGVILPLSGPLEKDGKALLEGIQYAVDVYNANSSSRVGLVVRDSKSQVLHSVLALQEMAETSEIMAVIGELESSISAAIAGVAQERGIPLLIPVATQEGLTNIGDYIFQLTSTVAIRGRFLAEYAVEGLNLKRFGILAPEDAEYGKGMIDAFNHRVVELGGEILAEQWYFQGAETVQPQFKALREVGIRTMVSESKIVIVPEHAWDDSMAKIDSDTIFVKKNIHALVDTTGLAVTAFDGIFMPVFVEDIPYVTSQLANYNFNAKLLGGTFWNDLKILEDNRRYIDGLFFIADFYVDPSNYAFYTFRDAYLRSTGKEPDKLETVGVDVLNFFMKAAEGRSWPRGELRDKLAGIQNFIGVSGAKNLNAQRVNQAVNLLQYRGGRILQIK